MKSWDEMRAWHIELLERATGEGLDTWKGWIADAAGDEAGLRAWLKERGVSGYAQMLLVYEMFGYPATRRSRNL